MPVKRKVMDSGKDSYGPGPLQYATVAGAIPSADTPNIQVTVVEDLTEEIVKVKSLCEKVTKDVSMDGIDPKLVTIFSALNEAIFGIHKVQHGLLKCVSQGILDNNINKGNQQSFTQVSYKKPRQEPMLVDLASIQSRPQHNFRAPRTETQEDIKVKKFRDTIREAEKSTVIFNLDLGRVPTINTDTMSSKVSVALAEKAAVEDQVQGKIPTQETMALLDDVLSVAKGMKFLGKVTKTYRNNKDVKSGSYCTLPVKYEFHDKVSRIYAENVLREKCKVQCATPYPLIVRECIKQIIEQVKKEFPNTYVRVTVDTADMCFKVYKRPMVDKSYKGKKEWSSFDETVPIPELALDLSVTQVPEDFKLMGIQFKKKSPLRKSRKSTDMEGIEDGPSNNSPQGEY
jgi:hypothetical protein